jgi:xanthosine utilization system XapX-like protein
MVFPQHQVMKLLRYAHAPLESLLGASVRLWIQVARRALAKVLAVSHARRPRGKTIAWVAGVLGILVQVVLVCLVWYLIDLCILLFEVWAELAAKHLEITLDTTP